jgi:L-asparaginase II
MRMRRPYTRGTTEKTPSVAQGPATPIVGGEGLLCLALPEYRLGVAIRDVSGGNRSLDPAAVALLDAVGLRPSPVLDRLREKLCPPVRSFTGETVGCLRPALERRRAGSA